MICLFQETFNNSLDKIVDLLWIKTIIKIEKTRFDGNYLIDMPPFSINVDQYNLLLIHFRFIFVNDADAIEDAK